MARVLFTQTRAHYSNFATHERIRVADDTKAQTPNRKKKKTRMIIMGENETGRTQQREGEIFLYQIAEAGKVCPVMNMNA